jgi:glycosyltransferase involved in cell wall biosynthesis
MKVVVVSQYFPPEAGATQNRMAAFVDGLAARGHEVSVICEQPNHPAGVFHPGFGRRPLVMERNGRRTVRRLWVAASPRKTTLRRLAFYGSFAAGAAVTTALQPGADVLFATSPPLPGAFAAALAARGRRTPFVLDVRDLWPAAAEALGELSGRVPLAAMARAERWLYRNAARVTATTRPFCRHIDRVAGRPVSAHLPNGALDELLELDVPPRRDAGTFVVGYVGNLGIAQGLGIVLDAAERLRDADVRFLVVGDGPLAEQLRQERRRRELDSVEIRPGVPVERLADVLVGCDALLVPLRAHPLLADFIPSKLYDAMAVGRPAIVAAEGEAAALARETGCGVVVGPEDGEALAAAILDLAADRSKARALGSAGREAAAGHARSRMVERLESVLQEAADRRCAA